MTDRILTPRWLQLAGGRQLYVEARSAVAGPTVVCESGMGLSRTIWAKLIDALPPQWGSVVYDRSGLGRSPATSGARDLHALADDLRTVVSVCAPAGPVVLIGHSWGGPVVRYVAPELAGRLQQLVLLDVTDERGGVPHVDEPRALTPMVAWFARQAARAGLYKLHARWLARTMSPAAAEVFVAESSSPAHAMAQLAELSSYTADLAELTARPPVLVEAPVVIVSGGGSSWMARRARADLIASHSASAQAYPCGRHVVVPGCDHYPMLTHLDQVLAVLDLTGADTKTR